MQVTVHHLGAVQFEAVARGHHIVCDQPIGNRGADAGMTPPELMLSAFGACAGFYAAEYLRARGLKAADLYVRVNAEKASSPARLGSFGVEVHVADLDPEHEAGMLRAVKACLIHNTLLHTPAVEITLHNTVSAIPSTAR